MRLLHPPIDPWLVRGAAGCDVTLLVRGSPSAVFLRAEPDNEELLIPMERAGSDGAFTRYRAHLAWDPGNDTTYYAFKVIDGKRQLWLAADGVHPHPPPHELHFKVAQHHVPPAWIADQIVYQIFPDRFCQGDPALAVRTDEYVYDEGRWRVVAKPWGAPVDPATAPTAFYGGDLIGVRHQLSYLADELGVTTIYLNPVFTSGSNHKYDTEDYFNVDPHLGGNAALAALSDDLHRRGMRLILDAVVNHTGANHPWFDRFGRHAATAGAAGAFQSEDSSFRSWYTFGGEHGFSGWKGHLSLPVLDFSAAGVRDMVYESDSSILRHWLRPPYAIDGWRFDVIHMLGERDNARGNATYAREFRRVLKEENPEAYFLGEHFNEATRWLQGEQEDGAMNYYGFAQPVRNWLAGKDLAGHPAALSTAELERWMSAARARVPYANQLAQLNLLDSHDTSRLLTALESDVASMRLALTLLLTYPGAPCIYYGDEIGLEGGNDPDCRRCFDWEREHWNATLHQHVRQLIALRKQRVEWRRGAYQTLAVGDDALVFARYARVSDGRDSATVIAINRGAQPARCAVDLTELPVVVAGWRSPDGQGAALAARASGAGNEIVIPAHDAQVLLSE